jgi:hypothetical protein
MADQRNIIRAFAPFGLYLSEAIMWAAAAYYPAPDIVLTACHFDQSFTGVGFYSEFQPHL